MHCIISIAVI